MALITLDKVSKVYPKGTRPALDDITLHINRGDFVFLVGSSGSGKTTLLSLLLREEEATDGEIHVAGNDLRRLPNRQIPRYRRSLGFVFQDYKLLNNKTVWQNVAFALAVIGESRSTIRTMVPKVLETVGLTGKERNYPHELSGGEAQRVAIARAYVNHPQILLADEPTGNLDPTTSLGIMEVLDSINRLGTTIVMATHNEEIVNSMRRRVVELHEGVIVRDEARGSYDSSLYYEKESAVAESSQPRSLTIDGEDDGIARLATSLHSGRVGRYGEAFQPVETTMTWGKGIDLESQGAAGSQESREQEDSEERNPQDGVQSGALPPSPPSPPTPPEPPVPVERSAEGAQQQSDVEQGSGIQRPQDEMDGIGADSAREAPAKESGR
ncbi:cell division ATP-binding protein FtsE [uncultured Bifidobacterium sp.]|uniref:cell division ATP-binding protein FtsE n=1 Tax=uncultured Bifidobacterium sp. TaxID=165187 RepID=UPI002617371D|nr:cell division ATP-binding protein FtsE [uncultured Bifidobacterium sp.]